MPQLFQRCRIHVNLKLPCSSLGLADCDVLAKDLHFEYIVNPPNGRGKSSHTDLMVRSKDQALAIEAKWTEPRYEEVDKWLVGGHNPANRIAVMGGWIGLLQRQSLRPLALGDFGRTVYQMVHRAASAIASGERASLAYIKFSTVPSLPADGIYIDLQRLHALLGSPRTFPFHLIEMQLLPMPAFHKIRNLPKSPISAPIVRQAIIESTLFGLDSYRLRTIRS
jgi:hypothetical protein